MRKTTRSTGLLLAATALVALAGCSKKPKTAELPPAPPSATTAPADTGGQAGTGASTPGSRADFIATAGTDTVHFGLDSSDLDSEAQGILTAQIGWLKRYPNVRVTVEGHCDERGTREYNLALGDRRANAARAFLVNAGIPASRLTVISYGKERPVAEGSDESAYAQNRRAVTVVPE